MTPNTGKLLWKFFTIALTGEPGGDTWGNQPNTFRAGGNTWLPGSYDPELDTPILGHVPGHAVHGGEPRHVGLRQSLVHELHAGAEAR